MTAGRERIEPPILDGGARRGGRRPGAGRPRSTDLDGLILDAALELLNRLGYRSLRVEEVASIVGTDKSTIYRRWPTKAALVAAAVDQMYLGRVAVPDTGRLRSDLVALLSNSYDLLIAGPGRVFADLIRESGQRHELIELVTRTMRARRRLYYQVLNRAIARGEIAPEIDHELAIDLLLGPLWVRMLVLNEPIDAHAVTAIVDAVLYGLTDPERPSD